MENSKWTKQTSGPLTFIIIAITIVIVIAVATLLNNRGQSQNLLGQLLVSVLAIGGLVLAYILSKRNANMMSRMLSMEYQSVEFALRKVLKDKNIRFSRQEDEVGHHIFELLATSLTTTIRPYDPIQGSTGSLGKLSSIGMPGMPLSATLVTLSGLNSKNRELVEMLAEAIDGIEIQEANNENTA